MQNNEILLWVRKKAGFSQQEAADLLEVKRLTISRWERGVVALSSRKLTRFMQLANISTDELPKGAVPLPTFNSTDNYDDAGYPLGFRKPLLSQFTSDEAFWEYLLFRIEGEDYDRRAAYRASLVQDTSPEGMAKAEFKAQVEVVKNAGDDHMERLSEATMALRGTLPIDYKALSKVVAAYVRREGL